MLTNLLSRIGVTHSTKTSPPRVARLRLEALESREVPAVVSYDIGAGLSVRNSLVLDQKLIYEDANYEEPESASNGAIQIQIVTGPTKGSAVLFGSTTFGYTPTAGYSGTDSFTWKATRDGIDLGGIQTVQLNLPPGGYGSYTYTMGPNGYPIPVQSPPPTPTGTASTDVTILPFAVSANNSDRTLFLAAGYPSEQVGTTIDLTAQVTSLDGSGVAPTGKVIFTATQADGTTYEIGSAAVGADGTATAQTSTQLLPLGTLISAIYGGDAKYNIKKVGDGARTASDLTKDVKVNDNPTIDQNSTNITVVIVGGKDAAEQLKFAKETRSYYNRIDGKLAYIITDAHNVKDVGDRLATFPPGSISKLILTGHGNDEGMCLDGANISFGAKQLQGDLQSTAKIKTALLAGGRLEFQSCEAASSGINPKDNTPFDGKKNMKKVAQLLGVAVWGADKLLYSLDYGWNRTGQWRWDSKVTWYRSDPDPAITVSAVAQN